MNTSLIQLNKHAFHIKLRTVLNLGRPLLGNQ